ncbi:MAG: type II toxin-antitoxin system VapC family toxin [Bifidobacteriaceae bacterium]|jgi:toxin-antitoxin system PIN domain toxin|nr:type II toxin-antitoxin system VapC family toxin [Bifidobacteriaceae bacterium]
MIVDANVLLYAVDTTCRFHAEARTWLVDAINGPRRVGLPWPSLLAFQRIATHPRVFDAPLTPSQAWSHIADWLAQPQVWIPTPGPRHAEILGQLILETDAAAGLVPDAHLAALALEYGMGVCSFDSDFARFPAVSWLRPHVVG